MAGFSCDQYHHPPHTFAIQKESFSVTFFLLCFVVGKHASHSLEEIEDIEKGNVFSCKKN